MNMTCNHIRNDFVPYWKGSIRLSGGDVIDSLEERFVCLKCGKVYSEAEFDSVPDELLETASAESIADNYPPGAHETK